VTDRDTAAAATATAPAVPAVPERRGRTRLGTEQRREQLLRIGAELFAERPYDEVWINRVAELAGVSRGLLYHYFPTKRDFFVAVVRNEGERLLEITATGQELPLAERLAAGLDAYLRYAAEHAQGYRAFHRAAATADREVRAVYQEHLAAHEARIVAALNAASGLPAEALGLAVRGWLALVIAVCLDWLERGDLPRAEVRDLAVHAQRRPDRRQPVVSSAACSSVASGGLAPARAMVRAAAVPALCSTWSSSAADSAASCLRRAAPSTSRPASSCSVPDIKASPAPTVSTTGTCRAGIRRW
jgi:AcrR family transcriptional regulator